MRAEGALVKARRGSLLEQSPRELLGIKGLQVVGLLADTDEFDGQTEFLLDRDHHAAFAGAVELGDARARKAGRPC